MNTNTHRNHQSATDPRAQFAKHVVRFGSNKNAATIPAEVLQNAVVDPANTNANPQNALDRREKFAKAFGYLRGEQIPVNTTGTVENVSREKLKQFTSEFGNKAIGYLIAGLTLEQARYRSSHRA